MTLVRIVTSALLMLAVLPPRALGEETLQLSLPVACEPHKTCFIQHYVDIDEGPGAKDYGCGVATYDKHDGTDIRLLSAKAASGGVKVLAAADGTVKATRDGMEDKFVKEKDLTPELQTRQCGNGLVIDHGNGWETQYCHLQKGSVAVSKGQTVKAGDPLGNVGYSGLAEFAHLHFTVRHNGKKVDPFAPDAESGTCSLGAKTAGLWQAPVAARLGYRAGEIIDSGFTAAPVTPEQLDTDHTDVVPVTPDSPALLFYARFINLFAGDRVRVVVNGPGGPLVEQLSAPLEHSKARFVTYAGKKRREVPWQPGRYEARAEIIRDGAVAAAAVGTLDLAPNSKPAEPAGAP